jgi:hypothetical protein
MYNALIINWKVKYFILKEPMVGDLPEYYKKRVDLVNKENRAQKS